MIQEDPRQSATRPGRRHPPLLRLATWSAGVALLLLVGAVCASCAGPPGRQEAVSQAETGSRPEPSETVPQAASKAALAETDFAPAESPGPAETRRPAETSEPAETREVSAPAGLDAPAAPPPAPVRIELPPAPPATPAAPDTASDALPARGHRYLELAWRDLRRLDGAIGDMGPHRNAAAALVAAALTATSDKGGTDAGLASLAARYTGLALDACSGRWHQVDCERAALDLQRVALQYAAVLPAKLRQRLRREVAQPSPPPSAAEIANPWDFAQTENQRAVTLARSLAACAVAPTADAGSDEARAAERWADYAVAFLAAHDRQGWYEADSQGYLAISIIALLHLHDFAPDPRVSQLAGRQLNLLLADWAEQQVGGMPAGPRTRTYAHWALGTINTPWRAWAWWVAGRGDPAQLTFGDWPEIAVSRYRVPPVIGELLAQRRRQDSYAVRERRRFTLSKRQSVDAALYSWATPDYVLSASQAVDGLELAISGGQEISAWLLPEGDAFAPLYLWSRHSTGREQRWRSRAGQEQAVAHENVLLARLGDAGEPGYAYFAPPWGQPETVGKHVVVARYGGTFVALISDGGWQVAPAPQRVPGYFGGDKAYRGSWVAVPRRQPAAVALEAGRAAEVASFAAWKQRVAELSLVVERREGGNGGGGEPMQLDYRAGDGTRLTFQPGRRATVDGVPLDARAYPLHDSPFLRHDAARGTWRFRFGAVDYRFEALPEARR